ncbi:DUF3883 domain-containing protein [Parasphingorhabdus sp.]|uniref:DUF3883 domain-containing protein n=1 Tax=Parasphingorhabdus sp. TaxID=2709688 RepID=UPI003A8EE6B2
MGFRDVKSRLAVFSAMDEFDILGRDNFLDKYGFQKSRQYTVNCRGESYDSKPLLAAAHGIMFPMLGPLPNEFSGGKTAAGRQFVRLGFDVEGLKPGVQDWSLAEVEFVFENYLKLLARQASGDHFNKSEETRLIAKSLGSRNQNSILRKFGNISSILKELEQPWIKGFTPQSNTQALLEAIIFDRVIQGDKSIPVVPSIKNSSDGYNPNAEIDVPTGLSFPTQNRKFSGRKTDHEKREKQNRKTGEAGEKWAYNRIRADLKRAGREDLAKQVVWASKVRGDGLGYDIEAFDVNGAKEYIEIKTTNGDENSAFFLTSNEIAASKKYRNKFVLMRIFDFAMEPKFYRLRGDLEKACVLRAEQFSGLPK